MQLSILVIYFTVDEIKKIFSRTTGLISTKLDTIHPWVKGIQFCSNKGFRPFPKGYNNKF